MSNWGQTYVKLDNIGQQRGKYAVMFLYVLYVCIVRLMLFYHNVGMALIYALIWEKLFNLKSCGCKKFDI